MKTIKRIVIGLLITVVVLVGALAAVPFLFKDQLIAETKTIINNNVNAEVDFGSVNLSIFRHFPDLTLALNDFSIKGIDDFQDIRLANADEVALTVDIMTIIRNQPINIKNIELDRPDVHVLVLSDGRANYNIAKPAAGTSTSDSTSTSSEFKIELDKYTISDGKIIYDDESLDTYVEATGINHQGKGAFTSTVYDLTTETEIASLDVNYGGIQYLNRAITQLDAIFNIDQSSNTYTLKDNLLTVNALKLQGDGAIQLKGDDINLDLLVKAPSNDFKDLLSIIPGAYLEGYEDVKATGDFALDAKIEGTYNGSTNSMPAVAANLKVNGANVQYPDLPLGITNIRAQASVNSPNSNMDNLQVDIPDFNLKIGSNPIAGRFQLTKPLSNPTIDTKIDGKLDLAELGQAFPMEGIEQLRGVIVANVEAKTNMKQIESGQYEQVNMSGTMTASDLLYKSSAYPEMALNSVKMDFSPQFVAIDGLDAKLGKSNLRGSGRIDNILAYFSPNATMKGDLNLQSDYFLVDEWMPSSAAATTEPTAGQLDTSSAAPEIFDRFDFKTQLTAKQIDYDRYTIKDASLNGQFTPALFAVESASAKIDDSDIQLSGEVRNGMDYAFNGETLTGNIQIKSNYLDLNYFMELVDENGDIQEPATEEISNEERSEVGIILVPENINMSIAADVKELIYTNMKIKNLDGVLKVANQAVELRDVKGQTLGGDVSFTGLYDTEDPTEPYYGMKLGMNRLKFQEAFQTLNTFQTLAPIGQFLEGIFNTSLSLNGTLGKGMMPNLSTLDATGFLETLDGAIKKYPPLEQLGEKLRIVELKNSINLTNTKNWFEISDGAVEVKPFDLKVDDIPMTIAGRHGLNMEMDYNIKAVIPREKLDNNALSSAIGQSMDVVRQQAQQLGIDLKATESVNVLINLTGTLKNPKFGVSLLGADGKTSLKDVVADKVNSELDKQKEKLGEAVDQEKEKLTKEANKAIDSAKTVLGKEVDALKNKAGAKVDSVLKKQADTLLKKEANKVLDTLLKKDEVDKLKKELEQFNPFKKKKKTEEKKDTSKTGGN